MADKTFSEDGYSYTEDFGSPREYVAQTDVRVDRHLLCDWGDRLALARALLGYRQGSSIKHPHKYKPEGGTDIIAYAQSVQTEPVGRPTSATSSYEKARLIVTYGPLTYDTAEGGEGPWPPPPPGSPIIYATESLEASMEFLTLPRNGLYFDTGVDKVSLDSNELTVPAKLIPLVDWVYTLHGLERVPNAFFALPGTVNDADVYSKSLGFTFFEGTLLAGTPTLGREYTDLGVTMWSVTMRFTYRNNGTIDNPKGWNHFPRTDEGSLSWERITDGADNVDIYETADFSQLVI
ncbi:MAG: hypothetical protein KOO60_07475 [Gemmatimonadales bacterium]|nr:hypothetical protein [Gemmatimonadales bacterium]